MIDILFEVSGDDDSDLIFIEVENADGLSVNVGEWIDEVSIGRHYRRLRLTTNDL